VAMGVTQEEEAVIIEFYYVSKRQISILLSHRIVMCDLQSHQRAMAT
jgi:hypothetical protein